MAFSRFGTMFFANPVVALHNIRQALAPGGRLVMVVSSPAGGARAGRPTDAKPTHSRFALSPHPKAGGGRNCRRRPSMHRADDPAAVDALEVDAGDAQVGVSELALDHNEGNAFVRHLDRVRVSELMRRESTPDTSCSSCVVELLACRRRLPPSSRGRSVDHA